jgi:hypothetical protein
MSDRIVNFYKDSERTWYIRCVSDHSGCFVVDSSSHAGFYPSDYRWNFRMSHAGKIVKLLKKSYNLAAHRELDMRYGSASEYNVYVEFVDDADEAAFMMLASAGQIIVDDEGDHYMWK